MREEIEETLVPLVRKRLPVRWVPPENLHVTLRFLGDITDTLRVNVEEGVSEAISRTSPFSISLGMCGAFPRLDKPRVLWVGLRDGEEEVRSLARRVDTALCPLGFDPEKKFHPHITVGRVKAPLPRDGGDRFANLEVTPFRRQVQSVELMKSTLTPKGAIYEVIRKIDLRPA